MENKKHTEKLDYLCKVEAQRINLFNNENRLNWAYNSPIRIPLQNPGCYRILAAKTSH